MAVSLLARPFVRRGLSLALVAAAAAACSHESRLKTRCLAGEIAVCTELGDMYANGRGVPRDPARAQELYERACQGGAPDVCNTLGEICEKTGDLSGGLDKAAAYYRTACEGRSSAGCLNLGRYYAAREETARAAELYERSCGDGWAAACHQLAAAYEQGEGIARDLPKAVALYTQACEAEFADSCVALGVLYSAGGDLPRDTQRAGRFYAKAFKLYTDACEAGVQADCADRERLRVRLSTLSAGPPVAAGDARAK